LRLLKIGPKGLVVVGRGVILPAPLVECLVECPTLQILALRSFCSQFELRGVIYRSPSPGVARQSEMLLSFLDIVWVFRHSFIFFLGPHEILCLGKCKAFLGYSIVIRDWESLRSTIRWFYDY